LVDLSVADQALTRDLNARLRSLGTWSPVISGRAPYWYGQMLTGIVLTLGDATVRFLTGSYLSADDGKFAARVVLFTDAVLVRANVAGRSREDVANLDISAIPRSALQRFGAYGTTNALEQSAFTYWPGSVWAKLRYTGETKDVELPLDMPAGETAKEELRALVATLPGDLLGTRQPFGTGQASTRTDTGTHSMSTGSITKRPPSA
jgi:hypothetical protein